MAGSLSTLATVFSQAPLRVDGWRLALSELCRRLGCTGAAFLRVDGRRQTVRVCASGSLQQLERCYLELCGRAADVDPRLVYARSAPRDAIWCERDLPGDPPADSPGLYRLLREAGADYVRGVVLAREGDESLVLTTVEPAATARPEAEARADLVAVLPVIRLGLDIERALARAGAARAAEVAAALAAPVALLTNKGRALAVTPAAAAGLARSDCLRVIEGRFAARPPELARAVEMAVEAATDDPPREAALGLGAGVGLRFLPLEPPSMLVLGEAPAVCMVVTRDAGEPRLTTLATRAGLSPAETEVLRLVVQGLPVEAVAERRGASRETVRSQLKSIYQKTGATSRADLLRAYYETPVVEDAD